MNNEQLRPPTEHNQDGALELSPRIKARIEKLSPNLYDVELGKLARESGGEFTRGELALEAQLMKIDPLRFPKNLRDDYLEKVLGDDFPHDDLDSYRAITKELAERATKLLKESAHLRKDLPPYDIDNTERYEEDETFDKEFYGTVNTELSTALSEEDFEIQIISEKGSALQILFKGINPKTGQQYSSWVKIGDMSPFGNGTNVNQSTEADLEGYGSQSGKILSYFYPFREDMEGFLGLHKHMKQPQSIAQLILTATNKALHEKGLCLKSSSNTGHTSLSAKLMWQSLEDKGLASSEELPDGSKRYWMN
jgi:hypothetical protein